MRLISAASVVLELALRHSGSRLRAGVRIQACVQTGQRHRCGSLAVLDAARKQLDCGLCVTSAHDTMNDEDWWGRGHGGGYEDESNEITRYLY
jgi:hypothetical protein